MTQAELDSSSGVPMYRQIKEILQAEIIEGRADALKPMTEARLLTRFGVSRAPIRQALRELSDEGYVYRKQGKGTFPVPGKRVDRPADVRPGALYQHLAQSGLEPTSEVSAPERIPAPKWLQERLSLGPEETLLHFTRVISVGGTPLVDGAVYLRAPGEFNPSAAELAAAGSAFSLLEQTVGIALDRAEHEAWATAAPAGHAAVLQVPEGSPLLAIETVFFTTGGVPAGWRLAMHKADDFKYHFVSER